MSPSHNSTYEILAQSLTVKDIAQPIVLRVPPDATTENVRESWKFFFDIPCIVSDLKKTYGVIWIDDDLMSDESFKGTAKDIANPILAENIISWKFR